MITATFGLSETGSIRDQNQDALLIDAQAGVFAVADGLGGLPYGDRASRLALDILRRVLHADPHLALLDAVNTVNREAREVGFGLDPAGFGTTLTVARLDSHSRRLELAHVGDSAALLRSGDELTQLTVEHTVAARMVENQWEDACESIPPSAHHTLTQCIGQEPYIDPQVLQVAVKPGDRLFLATDGVVKPVVDARLRQCLLGNDSLERICQALTFQVEIAGSPDNYTIVAVEFR
jgi:protein phosphatase